jgi:hypothetical protein
VRQIGGHDDSGHDSGGSRFQYRVGEEAGEAASRARGRDDIEGEGRGGGSCGEALEIRWCWSGGKKGSRAGKKGWGGGGGGATVGADSRRTEAEADAWKK